MHIQNRLRKDFAFISVVTSLLFISGCSLMQPRDNSSNTLEHQIERQQMQQELLADMEGPTAKTAEEYEVMGDQYILKGDINRAYLYYTKGLENEPERTSLLHKKAALLLRKNKTTPAKLIYDQLLVKDSMDALAHEGLGRTYFNLGEMESAREHLQKAAKIKPSLWKSHQYLGLICSEQQKYNEAIDLFKTALAYKPGNEDILNNLAVTYYLQGNFQESIRLLRNIPAPHKNRKIFNNLALAYFQTGQYSLALDAFKKGTENEAFAYYNMGNEYLQTGMNKEAARAFTRAIDRHPQYFLAAEKGLALAKSRQTTPGAQE